MDMSKKTQIPYGWAAKWMELALQNADSLNDEDIKKFLKALITPQQGDSPDNYEPHSLIIYNAGKTSLSDIRAAVQNFDFTCPNIWNCDLKEIRVCGRGITQPALKALHEARLAGYDIRFIDLT